MSARNAAMNSTDNLRSQRNRVKYLYDTVPDVRDNPMLLFILYWELFDGITIPKDIAHQLLTKAAEPQVLGKEMRWAARLTKAEDTGVRELLEEAHNDDFEQFRHTQ